MNKAIGVMIACSSCLASLFGYLFYTRYWKYRIEINQAKSSYITDDGVNVTSGGIFWAFPSLLFISVAFILAVIFLKRRAIAKKA